MNPHTVGMAHSEDENQGALFSWLNMASLWGVQMANEPRAYTELGFVKKHGMLPPTRIGALRFAFAVPNGAHMNSARTAAIMKTKGMKNGVPDIFVPTRTSRYAGLFIELKSANGAKVKSGKTHIEQTIWRDALRSLGYRVESGVVGWHNARDLILEHIKED